MVGNAHTFLRYVKSRYEQYRRDVAYRIYVSDSLRIITENTAKAVGGSYIEGRYKDIIKPKRQDNRTAEQIIADTLAGAGIEVIK